MFDIWEEAKANEAKRGKAEMRKLIGKYGFDLNEDDMELGDSVAYQMFGKYKNEAKREIEKNALCRFPLGEMLDEKVKQLYRGIMMSPSEIKATMMEYLPSVQRAEHEALRLTPMPISDENKHQYVSCVGAQGGLFGLSATLAGGIYKEGKDLRKKLFNSEIRKQYGGALGVVGDSVKDMKNNVRGASYGVMHRGADECDFLLKRKIK